MTDEEVRNVVSSKEKFELRKLHVLKSLSLFSLLQQTMRITSKKALILFKLDVYEVILG